MTERVFALSAPAGHLSHRERQEARTPSACHCEEAHRADVAISCKMQDEPKPPLCKGRWHGEAVTEGL